MNTKKRKFKKIFLDLVIITSMFFQNTVFADEIKSENNESNKEKSTETKWFDNPNDTNLFYIPTARIKKAGTGYFKLEKDNISLFIDTNYAITDNISLGLITGPGLAGFFLAGVVYPKIGFEIVKDLNIAVGIGYGAGLGYSLSDLLPVYEVITYGNANNNITAGFGQMLNSHIFDTSISTGRIHILDGNILDKIDRTIIFGGGMYRVSKNASIVMETHVIPEFAGYVYSSSLGVRFFEKNFSFDLAASVYGNYANSYSKGNSSVYPGIIIDFSYPFKGK